MKILLVIFTTFIFNASYAQSKDSSEGSDIERFVMPTTLYKNYWAGYVLNIEKATGNLDRTFLIKRCLKERQIKNKYFFPDYRAAIDSIIIQSKNTIDPTSDPAYLKYQLRAILYAYDQLTPAEKYLLNAYSNDMEMRQLQADIMVINSTPYMDWEGEIDPAAPVFLKTYFEKSGRLTALRRAISSVSPRSIPAFDKVSNIERLSSYDADWLKPLGSELFEKNSELASAYLEQAPQVTIEKYMEFTTSRLFTLSLRNLISETSGNPFGAIEVAKYAGKCESAECRPTKLESAANKDEIEKKYPIPLEVLNRQLRSGPVEYVGSEYKRFCPN